MRANWRATWARTFGKSLAWRLFCGFVPLKVPNPHSTPPPHQPNLTSKHATRFTYVGVSLSTYHGSFFLRSTDLLALPNVNPQHSYTAQCVIDDKIVGSSACFQAAILFTSAHGERRIRVLNMTVGVTDDPKELLAFVDQGAVLNLLAKMAVEKALASRLEDARDALLNKCVEILGATAAAFGTKHSSQLSLLPNLRGLPLGILGLLKMAAFRGGAVTPLDFRAFCLTLTKTLGVDESIYAACPFFCALHNLTEADGQPDPARGNLVHLPQALIPSAEYLSPDGIFLCWNGCDAFIWIGSQAYEPLVEALFGSPILESGKVLTFITNPRIPPRLQCIDLTLRVRRFC